MKKILILNKDYYNGILEYTLTGDTLSVMCNFENALSFDVKATYILELHSAKKPHLKPYKICEAKFTGASASFSGNVSEKVLASYGYIPLDIDTFVITERKLSDTDFRVFIKAFTGLIWDVDAKYKGMKVSALENAKEKLESIKKRAGDENYEKLKQHYLNKIEKALKAHTEIKDFPQPYKWYFIKGLQPICSLSALKHALFNPLVSEGIFQAGGYYMGIYNNHLAIALKTENCDMPFTNLADVEQNFFDAQNTHKYCTVGILLEDDGQYFEKILAIGTK